MYKYEMAPTRTVGATEWTQDAGRTDGWTDGVKPIYPQQLRCVGGIKNTIHDMMIIKVCFNSTHRCSQQKIDISNNWHF